MGVGLSSKDAAMVRPSQALSLPPPRYLAHPIAGDVGLQTHAARNSLVPKVPLFALEPMERTETFLGVIRRLVRGISSRGTNEHGHTLMNYDTAGKR